MGNINPQSSQPITEDRSNWVTNPDQVHEGGIYRIIKDEDVRVRAIANMTYTLAGTQLRFYDDSHIETLEHFSGPNGPLVEGSLHACENWHIEFAN